MIASKVRLGISPAISALALVIITLTIMAAIIYEVLRRREDRKKKERQNRLLFEQTQDSRLKKDTTRSFKTPKSVFIILFILIIGIIGFNQLVKNDLYGPECVSVAEEQRRYRTLRPRDPDGSQVRWQELLSPRRGSRPQG